MTNYIIADNLVDHVTALLETDIDTRLVEEYESIKTNVPNVSFNW